MIASEKDLILKKECDARHKEVLDKVDLLSDLRVDIKGLSSHFEKDGIIRQIKKELIETKGNVKTINGKVAENTKWRNYLFASVVIISFLFPTMTATFLYFMNDMREDIRMERLIDIKSLVGQEVETYLKNNFEPIE